MFDEELVRKLLIMKSFLKRVTVS